MNLLRAAVLLLACSVGGLAAASGAAAGLPAQWQMQGQGEMRWFGFSLYEARLWTPPDQPVPTQRRPEADANFALELTYTRDIPGARLVSASIDELKRLGWTDPAQLVRWEAALAQVFPDVKVGDVIIGRHHAGGAAEFYHQGRRTGRIDDPELATAFFAIWLDPRTREPELRARLVGAS